MTRLNKYIASAGICSRRKADLLIENGNVKVNGVVLQKMGYEVKSDDLVEVNGRTIKPGKHRIYVMLNKPVGYITTVSDDRERATVMDLVNDIAAAADERIFPVGRLDINTSGLLLMTNDGDFAQSLSHPGNLIYKTYRARVTGTVSEEKINKLEGGVDIGGYVTSPAVAKLIKQSTGSAVVEIKIHEGKNRQVRKMFSSIGNKVIDLERVAIGDLYLGKLMKGHYRKLSPKEIALFK